MIGMKLYLAQRISALLMAPLVLLHLAVMVYAVQGGLSTGEILGRTQGSWLWGLVYGSFVCAVSIHAAIGIRVVVYEWFNWKEQSLNHLTSIITIALLFLGLRAVYSVVIA